MKKIATVFAAFAIIASAIQYDNFALAYDEVSGEFKNVAVVVEFSDTEEKDAASKTTVSKLDDAFNGDAKSLKKYIEKNSSAKLTVNTEFVHTVRISTESKRYMPRYEYRDGKYSEINSAGYDNRRYDENGVNPDGNLMSAEYLFREHELVALAAKGLSDISVSDADRDGDGRLDALTVIPCATVKVELDDEENWGSLFWPHMSSMYYGGLDGIKKYYFVEEGTEYEFESAVISSLTVKDYIISPYRSIIERFSERISVVCHEFMHILGAPDYYGYDTDEDYVGPFDIMGSSEGSPTSLAYLRVRMGWIAEGKEILAVEKSGEYYLAPTESGGEVQAYKIALSDYLESGDCYYIECRKLNSADDGIIIYRVNEKNGYLTANGNYGAEELGNMYGKPEVYVFRQWETFTGKPRKIIKGATNFALFDGKGPYTEYGSDKDTDKNLITNSDGANTKITISGIKKSSGGYKFTVSLPEEPAGDISEGANIELKYDFKGRDYITFANAYRTGYAHILVTNREIKDCSAEDILSGKYGEAVKIPVSFQKYVLPEAGGGKYAYLCLSDGEKHSKVYSLGYGLYKINENFVYVALAGGGIGLLVFITVAATIGKLKKIKKV